MKIEELNRLYDEGDLAGQDLYAEQRSNILLVNGLHYNKRSSKFWRNIRKRENISKEQKLRLIKNHTHKITRGYQNNILTHSPAVDILPRQENELQDQKAAELNKSVWENKVKPDVHYPSKLRQMVADYIDIGEVCLKMFYDTEDGDFLGYETQYDEDGLPVFDEKGLPVTKKVFRGKQKWERIFGFNLLSDPNAKSFEESPWVCYRKMTKIKPLEERYRDQPEKLKWIRESQSEEYKVFDTKTGGYVDAKGMMMLREYYFRPCVEYPEGYYFITCQQGIFEEGPLPLGKFPIKYKGFDEAQTYGRAHSIIKQLRPYQAEINRAASCIAETQITLGSDKLIITGGTSISPGGTAHGIKAVNVAGGKIDVLEGRTGNQYIEYMQSQITEMYNVANMVEDTQEKVAQVDPYAMLFRSIKEKKAFSIYADKFGEFLLEVCEFALELEKAFCLEETLIPAIGRNDYVNISEFKNTNKLQHEIKLIQSSEDIESKMGKQLSMNHLLQYAGKQLDPTSLGKLIRNMPYLNKEQIFNDLTLDYDNATNDILQMDRGMFVPPDPDENHSYIIKRLTNRMKQSDFQQLPDQVKANYFKKRDAHRQIFIRQQQEAARANAGYIPTGGYLVTCDFYVPDPLDPTKQPKRARIPYESMAWLMKRLEEQGSSQEELQGMGQQEMAALAQQGLGMSLPPQQGQAPFIQ